jgi:hypothetical protein
MARIMKAAGLGSCRSAGSTASVQGGRIGNGLGVTEMCAARDFSRWAITRSAGWLRGARVDENLFDRMN